MRIGVPKEIKVHEYRVGLTPEAVGELTARGFPVIVQTGAGAGVDFSDDDYRAAGAEIVADAKSVFDATDMIVKVKEPQLHECAMLRPDHTLFTYLHLAADRPQAEALIASGATCIAYETVTDDTGGRSRNATSQANNKLPTITGIHFQRKLFCVPRSV